MIWKCLKKIRLYLDTSIPSAYFETSKPLRQLITQKWFENETLFRDPQNWLFFPKWKIIGAASWLVHFGLIPALTSSGQIWPANSQRKSSSALLPFAPFDDVGSDVPGEEIWLQASRTEVKLRHAELYYLRQPFHFIHIESFDFEPVAGSYHVWHGLLFGIVKIA